MMINALNAQLARAQNDAIVQQRAAAAAEEKYAQQAATYQNQTNALIAQNAAAAKQQQSQFAAQLAETKKANEATVAGLNQLLLDQQATAKAQADAFAVESAAAEARYQDQVARASRIASAVVPDPQPTAQSPLIGDQRTVGQPVAKQSSLSQLSIISNPSSGPAGASKGQLSGLQIA